MWISGAAKNLGPAWRLGSSMFTSFAPIRQPCACAAPAQAGEGGVEGPARRSGGGVQAVGGAGGEMTLRLDERKRRGFPGSVNASTPVMPCSSRMRSTAGWWSMVADLLACRVRASFWLCPSYLSQMRGRSGGDP